MSEKSCAGCGTANEADARFCEGCGSALDRRCSACGTQASARARFCRSCGGSLDGPAQPSQAGPTRKIVTVLFADLAGSTTFEEKVDAETAREVMGQYHELLREVAEHHRAGVKKYIGDGFMAVWGAPEVTAGDAEHAVDAAVELQDRFVGLAAEVAQTHGESLALRVAVNTGEVVVGSGDADLVGDALNVAARLESQCPLGHVVVGEETWRSTRGRYRYEPLSPVQVKGRTTPVAVYQWAGHRSEPTDSVPFVGRTHEFRRLQMVLEDAVARRAARLVTVIGDPGVGKTRLAAEFAGAQQDVVLLQIRCAAEGTVALAPVVEVLRTRDLEADLPGGMPERDRVLRGLTNMAGGVAGSVEETFWALRRYFEVLAGHGLLVLVLDDIQWADALLLDFVEHLSEWVRDVPILMVALARPELRETRPELVTVGGWVGDAIRLGGLAPDATAELAARVLGSDQLPADLLARLPSSTGGNPLFVRELVAMLVHDGVLVAQADRWRLTIDADAIAVPPTIQALLASRLERMNTADRRVLEIASVIGTDFSPAAVGALDGASALDVRASLDRLRRLELAQPSGAYSGDEPIWRFHHILIRDVAYRRLLKSDRAELHERFADWTEAGRRTEVFESDELVARHLESAHGYRCELGARDSHTAQLALRSARWFLSAARQALDRDALVSAGAQAARGAALAGGDAALRADLLLVGCEAFLSAGDVSAGAPLVDELERVADDTLAPWATCYRCQYLVYTDPSRLPEIDGRLQGAIDEFARRGDHAGSAKAYRVRANARARLGRVGECEADLFEALIAARQGSDHRQITAALGAAPNAALWGPSPAPKAGGRCLDVVRMQRMTTAAPSLEATSLRCLAVLELLRGRPDKARSMLADARKIVSELGLRHGLMETELYAGLIESMAGDPVAAEPYFRTALEGLDSLGVGADAGQAAALLARSLLAQGRIDEADRYAAESERIAGHNLKTAIGWRAVRAEILSAQGLHRDAVTMAREAVDVAAETDLVLDYADACMTLSRVLAASGDARGAAEARARGESLYAAKDAVFLVGESASPTASSSKSAGPAMSERTSRLPTWNPAAEIPALALQDQVKVSPSFVYEDRRKVPGESLAGGADLHSAAMRKLEQYPHVEAPVLAVRGERVALVSLHWWDDGGNQTTSLDLFALNENGELDYHGRFDEDDFTAAYRELEERYYADEGAEFAANGLKQLDLQESVWMQDVVAARLIAQPDFVWFAEPSTLKPGNRSLDELFAWRAERLRQVASFQDWLAALRWLSAECCVALCEMRGTGRDGEQFRWNRIYVTEYRDGLGASGREFDSADEDAAFAYAESLNGRTARRLAVKNRVSGLVEAGWCAIQAHDVDSVVALYSDRFVYDDRRSVGGGRLDKAALRNAAIRLITNYPRVEWRPLAVRGEKLELVRGEWSDRAGNKATYFDLYEFGDDDRIEYHGRFDEDDFLDAYAEMQRRYYAGEGSEFAHGGMAAAGWVEGIGRRDIEMVLRFSTPDFRWIAPPSSLKPAARTVEDIFRWMSERGEQVSSQRHWEPTTHWLSPNCAVALVEVAAAGKDGEQFTWNYIVVSEFRDGLLASVREFDTEDEAFAYAENLVSSRRRLATENRATETGQRLGAAMTADDIEIALDCYSQTLIYDDRRHLSGNRRPRPDRALVRASLERIRKQFNRFELRTLAVRGERLNLSSYRWSDASGNDTSALALQEIDDDGRIVYDGRFDEDDFESAYLELERRYYAGEGAAYAEAGATMTDLVRAGNRGDLDRVFAELLAPGLSVQSRSRTIIPSRTSSELRSSVEEFNAMVSWSRVWNAAVYWLSPTVAMALQERHALGLDGEKYEWSRIYVGRWEDGRVTVFCEFDVEFEDEAFAYAEELARESLSRLAVSNRASEVRLKVSAAIQRGDLDAAASAYSDNFVNDDRRRLSGEPVAGREGMRAALSRLHDHYRHFSGEILAVRGDRLGLGVYRCSDDDGNETAGLLVIEVDDEDLVCYEGRFDEDDFEAAYYELERRYCAGEGARFADYGMTMANYFAVRNRRDLDTLFDSLSSPDLRIETRSHSVFVVRSAAELRSSIEELTRLVGSVRDWTSAVHNVSPNWAVCRYQREALGPDGEDYRWERLAVAEVRDGRLHFVCDFDLGDEEAAFAYAEERARASVTSRFAVTNRANEVVVSLIELLRDRRIDEALTHYREGHQYDDRRRLSGEPITGTAATRSALERILAQYSHFEWRPLAVRGRNLVCGWSRWSDDAGNSTSHLHVVEIDGDDRFVYDGRFDEDDFESAYQQLDGRFGAGEGQRFAVNIPMQTGFCDALNRLDLEAARKFCLASLRVISPPTTLATEARSFTEFYAWIAERAKQVPSIRHWMSVNHWLSADCVVSRIEIRAIGPEGDEYSWPRIAVADLRRGRIASIRQFQIDEEDAAFGYAEEVRAAQCSRLPLTNNASEAGEAADLAMRAGDIETLVDLYAEYYVFDDRRRLSGDLISGRAAIRAAAERILAQFSSFESRILAVRGTRVALGWTRWSDDAGDQTEYLHVFEAGDDGRIVYAGRFDEDDFEAAYAELERRYYEGEGAAFAESGNASARYMATMNRGGFDTMVNELTSPGFRLENRSRSAFPDRKAADLRTSLEQLHSMVSSVRSWFSSVSWVSPTVAVSRMERRAVGRDGEIFAWSRILVSIWKDHRLASLCDFDADGEDAAFAYAEDSMGGSAAEEALR